MLKNLQAEITRSSLSLDRIAVELDITKRTLSNKINGVTEFNRDEMYQVRDCFFPTLGVEYLFLVEPIPPTLETTVTDFIES